MRSLLTVVGTLWLVLSGPLASASPASEELLRQGRAHEGSGEIDVAMQRYADAIAIDPTLADAYAALGRLRSRLGDYAEAERTFSMALARVPGDGPLVRERAKVRWLLGRREDAESDLRRHFDATHDPASAKQLAGNYVASGRFPAALSVWRTVASMGEEKDRTSSEALVMIRALSLMAFTDPALYPSPKSGWVRRAIALAARRWGEAQPPAKPPPGPRHLH